MEENKHKPRYSQCLTESTVDSVYADMVSLHCLSINQANCFKDKKLMDGIDSPDHKDIPQLTDSRKDYTLNDFRCIRFMCDGSNSNIYMGIRCSDLQKVVLKVIKEEVMFKPLSVKEFDEEFEMLCRLDHPNVIRVLGAGRFPRRFIVLECLSRGSISFMQASHKRASSFFHRTVFGHTTFSFGEVLMHARSLASAMHYLHACVHPDIVVIHRDLKADNVGFTDEGVLKLFDFGLSTCIRRQSSSGEGYQLTGRTGSLRFMAPEVAQSRPYSEKVDVYSFGMLVWQMAKDRVFKQGMKWADFMKDVVIDGERPKVEKAWPTAFSCLLEACWDADPAIRPSFDRILEVLDSVIAECRECVSESRVEEDRATVEETVMPAVRHHGEIERASEKHYVSAPGYAEGRSGWF